VITIEEQGRFKGVGKWAMTDIMKQDGSKHRFKFLVAYFSTFLPKVLQSDTHKVHSA